MVVSRPGYLRTPLASGATPEDQARLYAALLDSLRIDRVAVVGISGGGPSALQFARLFPERTRALVLAFAIVKRSPPDPIGRRQRLARALGLEDWFVWRAAMRAAATYRSAPAEQDRLRIDAALRASIVPRARRRAGDENDQRQFYQPQGWPIDGIVAPTLILAGTEDTTVPIAHAGFAKEHIPGARLVMIEGDHSVPVTRPREIADSIRTFLLASPRR